MTDIPVLFIFAPQSKLLHIGICKTCLVDDCPKIKGLSKSIVHGGCLIYLKAGVCYQEGFGFSCYFEPVSEYQPACSNYEPKGAQPTQ